MRRLQARSSTRLPPPAQRQQHQPASDSSLSLACVSYSGGRHIHSTCSCSNTHISGQTQHSFQRVNLPLLSPPPRRLLVLSQVAAQQLVALPGCQHFIRCLLVGLRRRACGWAATEVSGRKGGAQPQLAWAASSRTRVSHCALEQGRQLAEAPSNLTSNKLQPPNHLTSVRSITSTPSSPARRCRC